MAIASGTRLGPYEIVAPLGAGGMGEVYRARDTRLAREVAIKVLPESLASDSERLKRFEKEAKSASALNHPNIVTIHDIGSEGGVSYIAMELVDGTTLRELLASGPLPIKKLFQIAPQIAEGLARAHEAGIVHRDLKPENVMVKKDGLVKILDFGLAKLTSTGSGSDEASMLPTMTGTTPGVVVGTVGYMSPEQASGQALDLRSDQFSFGAILYEMATGKRAFQRKTAIDTLAAILNDEPEPIASTNPQTPAPLRWIVERCLAKEPRLRFASTEDLARDLSGLRDHLSEASSSGSLSAAGAARRRLALPVLGAIGAAVALILATALVDRWLAARRRSTDVPSFRQLTFDRGDLLSARFTPDGKTVVYGAPLGGAPAEIFSVRTDSGESRPIGLSRADVMSVSSKGELAVLISKSNVPGTGPGVLARVPIAGGVPREILEEVVEADWAPNGEDLAVVVAMPNGKSQLQYPIGTVLTEGDDFGNIRVSPNGDLVACNKGGAIATYDRKGKRSDILQKIPRMDGLVWSPRGDEILFVGGPSERQIALRAVSLSGQDRVLLPFGLGLVLHDVAFDGRLLMEKRTFRGEIACQPRGENRERELGRPPQPQPTLISEDGKFLLFSVGVEDLGIYFQKTDGSPPVRLGEGNAVGLSPDGRWVLTLLDGPPHELVMIPTGAGSSKKIPVEGIEPKGAWLLPNGKGILVRATDKAGNPVLLVVGPDGGKPNPVRADDHTDGAMALSPDGDHFVYATKGGQLRIGALSGGEPTTVPGGSLMLEDHLSQWSADGRFLYIWRTREIPMVIDRLELATGRRELWKKIAPQDSSGVREVSNVVMAPDGESYAYQYYRVVTSDLYVVEGAK